MLGSLGYWNDFTLQIRVSNNTSKAFYSEAVVRRRCYELFFKILQNPLENISTSVAFCINFVKKEPLRLVFSCEFFEIFQDCFFIEQLNIEHFIEKNFPKTYFILHIRVRIKG